MTDEKKSSLEQLLMETLEAYPNDELPPNVVIARIRNKSRGGMVSRTICFKFGASVVRRRLRFERSDEIVSVRGPELGAAIRQLLTSWRQHFVSRGDKTKKVYNPNPIETWTDEHGVEWPVVEGSGGSFEVELVGDMEVITNG